MSPHACPKPAAFAILAGGRPRILHKYPALDRQFQQVLQAHTAGAPMNADIKWTNLTDRQIAEHLTARQHRAVGGHIVKQLLQKNKYVKRTARKAKRTGDNAQRDAQFQNIHQFRVQYAAAGHPIISMNTKKVTTHPYFVRKSLSILIEV